MSTTTTATDPSAAQPPLLAGKVAIVTGASRGIGAAAARAFADAGAAVALAARDADALEQVAHEVEGRGGRAIAVPTDVADEGAVRRLVETTVGAFGRLDAAFNKAGGGGRGKAPLAELDTEEFDAVLGVNLRGAFLSMKHEIPAMLESGRGAIVNTSSTAGLAGAAAGIAPYASAKHGLQGLTKIAAIDYAERGIRVNAVAPGPILTDLLSGIGEERQRMVAQAVPMRRLGRPEEVAAAAVWLCSEEAGFVTGATLAIDGGKLAGVA